MVGLFANHAQVPSPDQRAGSRRLAHVPDKRHIRPGHTNGGGHHFTVYDISAFTDVDEFKSGMDSYLRALQETPTAPGHDRVLYAGLEEHEEEIDRRERGIPYHPEVLEWFRETTSELGLVNHLG